MKRKIPPATPENMTIGQAAEAVGVTRQAALLWLDAGVVERPAKRDGRHAMTEATLRELVLVGRMRARGATLDTCASVLRSLRETRPKRAIRWQFIVADADGEVREVHDADAIGDELLAGASVLLTRPEFDADPLRLVLAERIEKIRTNQRPRHAERRARAAQKDTTPSVGAPGVDRVPRPAESRERVAG